MSLAELLLDTLTLSRREETGRDRFNQPEYALVEVGSARGRIFALSTNEASRQVEGTRAIVKRHRAVLEHRTDVDERSVLSDASGTYEVLAVDVARDSQGPHHLELQLEKITP